MKRSIVAIGVLLLLAAIIGVERFNGTQRPEPKLAEPLVAEDRISSRRPQRLPAIPDGMIVAPPSPSDANTVVETVPESVSTEPANQEIQFDVSSERHVPEILHIQGLTILKSSGSNKESRARLWQAVQQVASGYEFPVMVFDLDGLVTAHSPFLVYANPRFDITAATEADYRALKEMEQTTAGEIGEPSD